jgi:ubiquinol-cytochrome c reductase cytochrome b subunit
VIVRRVVEGLDERLDGSSFIRHNLKKVFPDHWSYMLGEIALYSFVMLVLTGTFLAFFYIASAEPVVYDGPYEPLQGQTVSTAYDSVMRISFEVQAGLVMRQIHHWAALLFMGAAGFHLLRVFFTGAFRKPREMSWLLGVGLLVSGIAAGFSGYSLPDDSLSGAGLRIAYSAILSIPFIGTWIAFLFFGGEFPGPEILNRLLILHVFIVPLLLIAQLGGHLAVVWHQTHTQFRAPGRTEDTVLGTPVWPKFALKAVGLAFVTFSVLALLGGLFQINPVWLNGPFVPYTTASPSQPDLYVGWLEGLLRLWPNWEFTIFGHTIGELFLPGVVVPGLMFAVLAAWPFLEARVSGDREWHNFSQRPREAPVRAGVGAAAIALFVVLVIAGGNDVVAKYLDVEVDQLNTILRWLVLLAPVTAGLLTYWICRDLARRGDHPVSEPARIRFRRNAGGGFDRETPDQRSPAGREGPGP